MNRFWFRGHQNEGQAKLWSLLHLPGATALQQPALQPWFV
jgi:hypothetical protein